MTWALVVILCTMGYTRCEPSVAPSFYKTEEACHEAAELGQDFFNSQGKVIIAYECVQFGTPA